MLSKVVSSSIFKVFGMTRPGIEPRSPGPLANTLTAGPIVLCKCNQPRQGFELMSLCPFPMTITITRARNMYDGELRDSLFKYELFIFLFIFLLFVFFFFVTSKDHFIKPVYKADICQVLMPK